MKGASCCCSRRTAAASSHSRRVSSSSVRSHGITRANISDHFGIRFAAYYVGQGVQDLDCCGVTPQELVVVLQQGGDGLPLLGNDGILVGQPPAHDAERDEVAEEHHHH